MNKIEWVQTVAAKSGISQKDVTVVLDSIITTISDTLTAGDAVRLVGFGTFQVKERAARTGRTPRTGEPMAIRAKKVPGFKAGKQCKTQVG